MPHSTVLTPSLDSFLQAGLDSLGAVELRNAVATTFELQVPATLAFDYPTISSMAAYVAENGGGVHRAAGAQHDEAYPALVPGGELAAIGELSKSFSDDASGWAALVDVSCRYPTPSIPGRTEWALAGSMQSTPGCNADFGDFQKSGAEGTNIPSLVPLQRWDVDAVYHPGGHCRSPRRPRSWGMQRIQYCFACPYVPHVHLAPLHSNVCLQTLRLTACMCDLEAGCLVLTCLTLPHSASAPGAKRKMAWG